jgi:hypothetical protein
MFAAAASNRAEAGSLIENFSGEFGPTTTLGGIALGSETDFRFQATFDPTAGTVVERGVATFAASLSINIAGHGTYTSAPGAVWVVLTDPSFSGLLDDYGVGLSTSTAGFFFGAEFASASPAFTVETVAPTDFSSYVKYVSNVPLTIELTSGRSLVINDNGATAATASLTSAAVPEPSALIVAAEAALLVGAALKAVRGQEPKAVRGQIYLSAPDPFSDLEIRAQACGCG